MRGRESEWDPEADHKKSNRGAVGGGGRMQGVWRGRGQLRGTGGDSGGTLVLPPILPGTYTVAGEERKTSEASEEGPEEQHSVTLSQGSLEGKCEHRGDLLMTEGKEPFCSNAAKCITWSSAVPPQGVPWW